MGEFYQIGKLGEHYLSVMVLSSCPQQSLFPLMKITDFVGLGA